MCAQAIFKSCTVRRRSLAVFGWPEAELLAVVDKQHTFLTQELGHRRDLRVVVTVVNDVLGNVLPYACGRVLILPAIMSRGAVDEKLRLDAVAVVAAHDDLQTIGRFRCRLRLVHPHLVCLGERTIEYRKVRHLLNFARNTFIGAWVDRCHLLEPFGDLGRILGVFGLPACFGR